ncbi:MAG: hypothetical protein F6K53_01230 [Moorea sp. SIO4A1]|uniref:DNA adenine methylase n=1 Tax=Moorena sp. SIO4A1 TaxID=2607835 RepID=UPI00144D952D|nr:hypothetical protein [Moorena sp. SIO4A1]
MTQLELFNTASLTSPKKVINVASVPQRRPFRYAGGKTWLIPQIRQWLYNKGGTDKELFEPFAGGDRETRECRMNRNLYNSDAESRPSIGSYSSSNSQVWVSS